MNIIICSSLWTITFVFQSLAPSTLQGGMLLAPTLPPCKARYKPKRFACSRRLPKRQQKSFGRLPTPACCHQVRGRCSPAIAAGGCPVPHLLVLPAGVATLRSPGIPHRLFSPASPHPIVTLPFLAEITHLWRFPCTLFSSGNAAKQALLSWHLQEYTSVHRNIFAVSNPKYSSRRSYRNSAVGKRGASELHIFLFPVF